MTFQIFLTLCVLFIKQALPFWLLAKEVTIASLMKKEKGSVCFCVSYNSSSITKTWKITLHFAVDSLDFQVQRIVILSTLEFEILPFTSL